MSLHDRIMNIPRCSTADKAYREGHRDARHAAAELVLAADAELERLRAALSLAAYRMDRIALELGYGTAIQHEATEWVSQAREWLKG